jgi:oligopeptide transport system substrate-binding protein
VAVDEIRILPVQENSTMVNLFDSGKLDWSGSTDLPALQMASLSQREDYREVPYNGSYFYLFNVARVPDPRVRRALGMAIDREAIVNVLRGGLKPAPTYVPPLPHTKRAGQAMRFDPAAARKLLAEGGGAPASLQLLYNTNENHKRVAEMVQQMWKRHLGITVELVNQEWKVYLKTMHAQDFTVGRAGWIGIFLDPLAFLERWETGHGQNDAGWSHPPFDSLLARARKEPDTAKRLQLLQEAETLLLEQAPVLPIYWYADSFLLRKQVRGFKPYILNLYPVKYLSLDAAD